MFPSFTRETSLVYDRSEARIGNHSGSIKKKTRVATRQGKTVYENNFVPTCLQTFLQIEVMGEVGQSKPALTTNLSEWVTSPD